MGQRTRLVTRGVSMSVRITASPSHVGLLLHHSPYPWEAPSHPHPIRLGSGWIAFTWSLWSFVCSFRLPSRSMPPTPVCVDCMSMKKELFEPRAECDWMRVALSNSPLCCRWLFLAPGVFCILSILSWSWCFFIHAAGYFAQDRELRMDGCNWRRY